MSYMYYNGLNGSLNFNFNCVSIFCHTTVEKEFKYQEYFVP